MGRVRLVFGPDDLWMKLRLSIDANRLRVARTVASWMDKHVAQDVGELIDNPVRYLRRVQGTPARAQAELALLAIVRAATNDPDAAAGLMDERWQSALGPERAAWAWATAATAASRWVTRTAMRRC